MPEELEEVVEKRILPLVERVVHKNLGVHVAEIERDISDRLRRPLFDFPVDPSVPFKEAKRLFKKAFLARVLEVHLGNITDASKAVGIERESLHRLIRELAIPVQHERIPSHYRREDEVKNVIEETLKQYKTTFAPVKFRQLYQEVPSLTKEIVKELPVDWSFQKAEQDFERKYFEKALKLFKTVSATARAVGLRQETLSRKLKALGLR